MTGLRLNQNLLKVPLYIGGKSIESVKEEFGLDDVIKMASNESPNGPSPMALEAVRRALKDAHRYPGIGERDLRRKLAGRFGDGFTEENFVTGNGGSDVLRMITQAFLFEGGNTVMCSATFPLYHIFTTMYGGQPRQIPYTPDYCHDLPEMLAQIDEETRIVYLCSPNNPTGTIITQSQMDKFIEKVPDHVLIVLDESYNRYVDAEDYADSLEYIRAGKNIIVVRSFSKTAGLANLRVGYLVAPVWIADYVRHAQLPFHTSDIVLAAAMASMDDYEFHEHNRKTILEGRAFLRDSLRALGLACLDSHMNSVLLIDPPIPPAELEVALLRRGIIVRHTAGFGIPNGVRITVATPEDNATFIARLESVLREKLVIPEGVTVVSKLKLMERV
jgi:histidinol-phosphate aminotransferase